VGENKYKYKYFKQTLYKYPYYIHGVLEINVNKETGTYVNGKYYIIRDIYKTSYYIILVI